jgi:hypothetical protein
MDNFGEDDFLNVGEVSALPSNVNSASQVPVDVSKQVVATPCIKESVVTGTLGTADLAVPAHSDSVVVPSEQVVVPSKVPLDVAKVTVDPLNGSIGQETQDVNGGSIRESFEGINAHIQSPDDVARSASTLSAASSACPIGNGVAQVSPSSVVAEPSPTGLSSALPLTPSAAPFHDDDSPIWKAIEEYVNELDQGGISGGVPELPQMAVNPVQGDTTNDIPVVMPIEYDEVLGAQIAAFLQQQAQNLTADYAMPAPPAMNLRQEVPPQEGIPITMTLDQDDGLAARIAAFLERCPEHQVLGSVDATHGATNKDFTSNPALAIPAPNQSWSASAIQPAATPSVFQPVPVTPVRGISGWSPSTATSASLASRVAADQESPVWTPSKPSELPIHKFQLEDWQQYVLTGTEPAVAVPAELPGGGWSGAQPVST